MGVSAWKIQLTKMWLPLPPPQLHTAYYCPINYATAASAAAYASSSSRLRHKSVSSLSLPLSLPLLST